MKKSYRNILLLAFSLIFSILSLSYMFDKNRERTRHKLYEVSSGAVSHDYMLSSLNVTSIVQDERKLIWIGTSAGLNVYNGKDYIQYFHDRGDATALPDDYVNVIFKDKIGQIWIGTQNGLARYEGADRFKRFALPERHANIVDIKDATDKCAVIVSNGTNEYEVSDKGVIHHGKALMSYRKEACEDGRIQTYLPFLAKPKEMMSCLFRDAGGNLWVGYRNGGYQVLSHNIASFLQANRNALTEATKGKDIISLRRVGQYLMAGTTLRFYIYDMQSGRLGEVAYESLFSKEENVSKAELVDVIPLDEQRVCIVGSHEVLVGKVDERGLTLSNCQSVYKANAKSNEVLGMGKVLGQRVYITSENHQLLTFDIASLKISKIRVNSPWYDSETQLTPLTNGSLLLFMKDMHLAVISPKDNKIKAYSAHSDLSKASIDPAFAMQDQRGNLWLGTRRYGLYKLGRGQREIERSSVVSDVHVQGMVEDGKGQLWITTLKDAVCYNPTEDVVMMNSLVSSSQNEWQRQYFDNAICVTPDSCVVMGSSDGCVFIPSSSGNRYMASNKYVKGDRQLSYDHRTSLEGGLCLYGLDVKTRGGQQLTIDDRRVDGGRYRFAYDENSLTFHFFYPNYTRRSALLYQYMLEGYDADWHTPTYAHAATYENLPTGRYRFKVRLLASLSRPPLAEREVEVSVRPVPWSCAAAWCLYVALAVGLLAYINALYLRIRTNKMLLLNEQREKEREHRTKEENMKFFANISHEFRNPLTIIAGPLISLCHDQALPARIHASLNSVCMSVNRMLRLIDQMLEFNQLETDALRLQITYKDVEKALDEWVEMFTETTRLRHIHLDYQKEEADYRLPIDLDKLEKIVNNLFTNALKHTPDGGVIRIVISISEDVGKWFTVSIFNSGSALPEQHLQDVFKRYYQQTDLSTHHAYGWGTGIGLYYVKRLVGLHHGRIEARNTTLDNGWEGVEFVFTLPADRTAYQEREYASEEKSVMQLPVERSYEEEAEEDGTSPEKATQMVKNKPKILIVDDDIDVAQYVRSLFIEDYQVVNRYSAEAALADMSMISPDIILSDVVMGDMSGYEFCKKLKSDLMFSHIPFILITAKADMCERIAGLRLGAVAYVSKPFDPQYLQALVASQLENVLSLRKRLGENIETSHLEDALSAQDKTFMDELYGLMEKRSAEMELNVTTICRDLLISQSKFTYKLKELTGDTPGTFFRKYKLNKAAYLLKEKTHSISEIAFMTGFATAAHFSVAFKKQFGVSPSEYLR